MFVRRKATLSLCLRDSTKRLYRNRGFGCGNRWIRPTQRLTSPTGPSRLAGGGRKLYGKPKELSGLKSDRHFWPQRLTLLRAEGCHAFATSRKSQRDALQSGLTHPARSPFAPSDLGQAAELDCLSFGSPDERSKLTRIHSAFCIARSASEWHLPERRWEPPQVSGIYLRAICRGTFRPPARLTSAALHIGAKTFASMLKGGNRSGENEEIPGHLYRDGSRA